MTMNETTDQEWKPQTEGLHQIIVLLKESQSIDNTVQKNVGKVSRLKAQCSFLTYFGSESLFLFFHFKRLEELNKYPDFNNYLIFILTKLNSQGKFEIFFRRVFFQAEWCHHLFSSLHHLRDGSK